jgi:hypothetical protein
VNHNGGAGAAADPAAAATARAHAAAVARHANMESLYEYGSRVGFWRLHRLFTERRMPCTGESAQRVAVLCSARSLLLSVVVWRARAVHRWERPPQTAALKLTGAGSGSGGAAYGGSLRQCCAGVSV